MNYKELKRTYPKLNNKELALLMGEYNSLKYIKAMQELNKLIGV